MEDFDPDLFDEEFECEECGESLENCECDECDCGSDCECEEE